MIRVGVLRGGTGGHYNDSLESGAFVLANLPKSKYQAVDIFIDKEGIWHINGIPATHEKLRNKVDVVWNSLHGFYGEDGKLGQLLENLGIPYTGTGILSSAILSNNKLAKERFSDLGVRTLGAIYVEEWGSGNPYDIAREVTKKVFGKYSPPWKVSPISRGHAGHNILCKTQDELSALLKNMCELKMPVMIEETIVGKDASIVVMPGFRNKKDYVLFPEDTNNSNLRLKKSDVENLENIAKKLHHNLLLGAYSKVKVCINPKGGVFVCGIETVPDTSMDSVLHKSLSDVGSSFAEFAEHMITTVLNK